MGQWREAWFESYVKPAFPEGATSPSIALMS
jgi:hypothetical protein